MVQEKQNKGGMMEVKVTPIRTEIDRLENCIRKLVSWGKFEDVVLAVIEELDKPKAEVEAKADFAGIYLDLWFVESFSFVEEVLSLFADKGYGIGRESKHGTSNCMWYYLKDAQTDEETPIRIRVFLDGKNCKLVTITRIECTKEDILETA